MPNFMLSTCGTSVLTNGADPEELVLLRQTANDDDATFGQRPGEVRRRVEARLARCSAALASADVATARRLSAELNGVAAWYGGDFAPARGDHHVLLVTDTVQGKATAHLLAQWLRSRVGSVDVWAPDYLRTGDAEAFAWGTGELIKLVAENVPGFRRQGYRVLFNAVGGFKSVQALVTVLGMLYADEVFYLFEAPGSPLIRIPRLPVQFDPVTTARQHGAALRRLALRLDLSEEDVAGVPEALLSPDQRELSLFGLAIWEEAKRTLYSETLMDSPSGRVRFTDRFREDASGLAADRLRAVNERIDDLVRRQHHGQARRRLDLKALKADPCPPATHEVDAWAEGDARRIYLRFEGDAAVLLQLGRHL